MVISLLLLIGVFALLLALYIRKTTEWKNAPPGPTVHPFLGSLPHMVTLDPVPYRAFHQLSTLFGPVVRVLLGVQNMMILSGLKEMKEVLSNEELDNRGLGISTLTLIRYGDMSQVTSSISFFSGPGKIGTLDPKLQWRELRRFTLKSLRDLGFAKSASEEAILEETSLLVDNVNQSIKKHNGVVRLGKTLNCAALNVVWNLIGGNQFQYDDPNMHNMLDYTAAFMLLGKDFLGKPFGAIPFLRYLPPYKSKFIYLKDAMGKFKDFIIETVQARKEKRIPNEPSCFIDDFLDKTTTDDTGIYTEDQLVFICIDMFIAGSETTSKSQEFALAMMIHHPDVQEKVQQELDSVAKGRKFITMADKDNLPYTEAVLNESWRINHIAPSGPPRLATHDVKVGQYTIPAGTQVMYNTYTLHMDREIWGDPHQFRPERFLENGKFKQNDKLFPFGIGRRRCLGESLARMENFLFFSNLMLNFSFEKAGDSLPSLEPDAGFTNGPYPYSAVIQPRIKTQ